jgi:hypothetical protein
MNNNWLKILVGLSAVLIAGTAAYFSVTGLGVLFSGAAIAVMVMAGSLEFAKLVTATYLKQKWTEIKGFNKWYLSFAVAVLMLITSAGIFGYLSNAFQQQNLKLDQVEREISVYQNQITKNDGEIARYTTQLTNQQNIRNSQESNLSKQIDKDKSTARVTQMIRTADKEISSISNRIDELTKQNNVALDSINAIKNNNISIEREVGGFRFVAESFGVELNSVVKFFIILIVIVFDPLAIALVIAFNQLMMNKRKEEDEEVISKPEDLKDFVDETTRVRLSERDLEILEKHLLNPEGPNEKLKEAAQKYSDKVREKHVPIKDFNVDEKWDGISQEVWDRMELIEKQRESIHGPITEEDLPPTGAYANSEHREKLEQRNTLVEMMKLDQELGLYDEPFDNPMIKESERLTKMDEELKLQEEEYDDDISDWDATLMDGLEDEPPFFTDEEIEKILQEQPTEEEIEENFSTIEPIMGNIFQDEDYLTDAILEFNQQSMEEEFDESIPEEEQTFGLDIKQLNETLEEVNKEIDAEIEETPPTEEVEKKKY